MRFLTKFAMVLVLPAFVPAEPFEPLVTVSYTNSPSNVPAARTSFTEPAINGSISTGGSAVPGIAQSSPSTASQPATIGQP